MSTTYAFGKLLSRRIIGRGQVNGLPLGGFLNALDEFFDGSGKHLADENHIGMIRPHLRTDVIQPPLITRHDAAGNAWVKG
jgi:hypothetical protein